MQKTVVANRAAQACAIALGVVSIWIIGLELLRPLHATDVGARAGIETAITLAALLSLLLLGSLFSHTRRVRDLLLLGAVAAISLTEFVFAALPAMAGADAVAPGNGGWLGSAAVVAIAFAAAALAPGGRVSSWSRGTTALAAAAGIGIVALGVLPDLILGNSAAHAMHHAVPATAHGPVELTVTLLSMGVLLAAGIVFVHRAGRAGTEAWLMVGVCLLLAASELQHLATPQEAANWVTPGDGLRLAAYGLLLAVALRRYAAMWRERAVIALNQERQRLTRDLHDGLAQDLAFIGTYAQRLEPDLGPEHPLVIAARRALGASRGIFADLAARSAPTTGAALRLVADELGARFDIQVDVRTVPDTALAGGPDLDPAQREEVVRIAREAIVNAVLHGRARHVDVVLDFEGGQLLLVSDDGCGLTEDPPDSRSGLGLATMQGRAKSLGGDLITRAGAPGGTELAVRVVTRAGHDGGRLVS
jgi:signal transduction histidine kinase